MYNSVTDTLIVGAVGVASAGTIAVTSTDTTVQIVQIFSGLAIAIAHMVFGYLIYKEQKKQNNG